MSVEAQARAGAPWMRKRVRRVRSARGRGGLGLVERERRRELAERVDLLLALGELLLCERDCVGAGDEAKRRLVQLGDRQHGLGELGRVAALLAVHALPEL